MTISDFYETEISEQVELIEDQMAYSKYNSSILDWNYPPNRRAVFVFIKWNEIDFNMSWKTGLWYRQQRFHSELLARQICQKWEKDTFLILEGGLQNTLPFQSPVVSKGYHSFFRRIGTVFRGLVVKKNEQVSSAKTPARSTLKRATSTDRRIELKWRQTHQEVLQSYANEWVVLEGEAIIAHGSDPAKIVIEAREKGVRVPYLFYVEAKDPNIIRMGL